MHMDSQQANHTAKSLHLKMKTPDTSDTPVFLAGNFNGWKLSDERYRLESSGPGEYFFIFKEKRKLPPVLEYKYNRGNWETVELDENCDETQNRLLPSRQSAHEDIVPCWKQGSLEYNPKFLPIIEELDEPLDIPPQIRTRRIAALLPFDYYETNKRYPVLYLQDGQNLFDDYAPFGNWAVDKKMAMLAEKGQHEVIIISIDHAEKDRIAEFTPSYKTRLGRGEGIQYAHFLYHDLKPVIDKKYRTRPDREHTGIGGSSMGGLISIYAGFLHPDFYSKLMIFSPSLWVEPNIHFNANGFTQPYEMRIYLYGGNGEGRYMVPAIRKFEKSLKDLKTTFNIQVKVSIDPNGRHNEARWGQEFPLAIEWLFFS